MLVDDRDTVRAQMMRQTASNLGLLSYVFSSPYGIILLGKIFFFHLFNFCPVVVFFKKNSASNNYTLSLSLFNSFFLPSVQYQWTSFNLEIIFQKQEEELVVIESTTWVNLLLNWTWRRKGWPAVIRFFDWGVTAARAHSSPINSTLDKIAPREETLLLIHFPCPATPISYRGVRPCSRFSSRFCPNPANAWIGFLLGLKLCLSMSKENATFDSVPVPQSFKRFNYCSTWREKEVDEGKF